MTPFPTRSTVSFGSSTFFSSSFVFDTKPKCIILSLKWHKHPKVGQIERVFVSASRQRSWDQFTKAQRKNITQWKNQLAVSVLTETPACVTVSSTKHHFSCSLLYSQPEFFISSLLLLNCKLKMLSIITYFLQTFVEVSSSVYSCQYLKHFYVCFIH